MDVNIASQGDRYQPRTSVIISENDSTSRDCRFLPVQSFNFDAYPSPALESGIMEAVTLVTMNFKCTINNN